MSKRARFSDPASPISLMRFRPGYGAEYVILSVLGGSRHTLRQFANEIIPEFNSDRAVGRETRLSVVCEPSARGGKLH
jgi:hypothetical protein